MTPVEQIAQLTHLAVIDPQFRNKLLDPDTRGEALEEAQNGWKRYEGIRLTNDEVEGLLNIEATDKQGFAMACASYRRLTSKK